MVLSAVLSAEPISVDQAIAAVLQFIIVIGYMFYHSWQLTLVVYAVFAPMPAAASE